MGNTATTPLDSAPTQEEVINALETPETVPDEVLASLMWDSPPAALLAALKEDDLGLSDFVWLDRKEQQQAAKEAGETSRSNLDEETRAKRIAEIRRRVEEEVARRKLEMALQEERAEKERKNALAPHCENCKSPITKGLIAAAAGNGKFYCKAHHPHNVGKKARKEADKATRPKRQRNNSNKAKGH